VESPILVVGAGPTGLTAACELTRHGVPVRIVEKLPKILPYVRATAVHSRTLEIFQDLGIVEEFLDAGQKILGTNQYVNGERFQHVRFEQVDSPYPFTLSVEQWRTEQLLEGLLERLGVQVERETELVDLSDRLDGVRATLRRADGREELVETPWLVACDGAHSRVRHLNHQRFPGEEDPLQYVLADVAVVAPIVRDEFHTFLTDRGTLFLFPLPGGRDLLMADIAEHHDPSETPALEEIQGLVEERGLARMRVSDPRWLGYFRIHYRVSRHYGHGRTLLAGDAVHVHSPVGGQGMNTGIQDAYNLAWKLALVERGRAPHALLESYEKERRAVAEDVLATTRAATREAAIFRQLPQAERERLYLHAALPELERLRLLRHREELDLDYRRSPICAEHRGRGLAGSPRSSGPHPGAQARDAGPLQLGDRVVTLLELLRGPRHTLLLFAGVPCEAAARTRLRELAAEVARARGDLVDVYLVDTEPVAAPPGATLVHDPKQVLHRRYDARRDCLYLIRPDGYVGFRSEPSSLTALRRHLDRVFTPR